VYYQRERAVVDRRVVDMKVVDTRVADMMVAGMSVDSVAGAALPHSLLFHTYYRKGFHHCFLPHIFCKSYKSSCIDIGLKNMFNIVEIYLPIHYTAVLWNLSTI